MLVILCSLIMTIIFVPTRPSKKTLDSVTVGSDIDYAYIHNNGGTINVNSRSELFVRNRAVYKILSDMGLTNWKINLW